MENKKKELKLMTIKNSILDSWIALEQFSEGNIKIKENGNVKYKRLPSSCKNWTEFFNYKIIEFNKNRNFSKKKLTKIGFTIFFDVFQFEELIKTLSEIFHLPEEYVDISGSEKFTYCLSFVAENGSFKLLENSLFYTISGHAHRYHKFPTQISNIEDTLNKKLSELFEYDFDKGMNELIIQETKWSNQNYYELQSDVTNIDAFLHSFYINDLVLAKGKESDNLNHYLFGFLGKRINLDSNKEHKYFNVEDINEILQPKNYPLGRFPSDPEWGLSLMQQVSVNIALNDKIKILGVNGPPGTGKTTLLKDVFAEHIVRQAYEICNLNDKHLNETYTYFKSGKIAQLPYIITDKNILVASSNNGALQNIVNEIPHTKAIDDYFSNQLLNSDYFKTLCNDDKDDDNWGMFATEGGKSDNIKKMITIVKEMASELKSENFIPDKDCYLKFMKQYKLVKSMRQAAQETANTYASLKSLRNKLDDKLQAFQKELEQKYFERDMEISQKEILIKECNMAISLHSEKKKLLEKKKLSNEEQLKLVKANLEIVKQQKPFPFILLQLFHHNSVKKYQEQLSNLSYLMTQHLEENLNLKKVYNEELNALTEQKNKFKEYSEECETLYENINIWKNNEEKFLLDLSNQVKSLEKKMSKSEFTPLDFTQSYSNFQQDNPWFNKKYRIEQSKLFFAAMDVRKQFLYENVKSLNGSWNIWNRISDYAIPDKKYLITLAWNWINFAIPVISTTFASFGGMFREMGVDSISNLFIDEAGQATPQSAVGAVLRSKRIMAVGDPSQIPPVIPLSNSVVGLIASHNNAPESVVNGYSSVQTLTDTASQYGYQKTEDEWIGVPLWVHRRCLKPMFCISNQISYDGQMVLPKYMSHQGKGKWFDIKGKSEDKFVKEQGEALREKIKIHLENEGYEKSSIYIISPFKNVVDHLRGELKSIGFPSSNIGTIHTFQGKEADIVYLVLGASDKEPGAARWAVSEPNLMNVAASRAKKEFYIIGDQTLYKSLKSEVVRKTLNVLNDRICQ